MRKFFSFLRKQALYVLFCAVSAVLALEIGIRWVGNARHLYTEPCFEMSSGGEYWTYKPGFEGKVLGPTKVRIGPLGSRLHGASGTAAASAVRVAVVGDSVTFGQAVGEDETFAARLSLSLNDMGHAVEVLNFGVQGHNVEMEIAHLRDVLAQADPRLAVLAFVSDDLNPKRAQNHVDRFGYLTKNTFGPPSLWGDFLRAALRRSHFVLLAKERLLRFRAARKAASQKPSGRARSSEAGAEHPELGRFRDAMKRFDALTDGIGRVVTCLDLRESNLSHAVRQVMEREFPHLPYVHVPPALESFEWEELIVRPDGHPSAFAHRRFAELLMPRLVEALGP